MLQIRLLGQFDVQLEKKRIIIPTRLGQSLVAYLALTAGTAHRREKLAGAFWPDTSDDGARRNLRQELWRIRKALATQQNNEVDYLLADEFTVTFNRNSEYWLDVAQVERSESDLESLSRNLAFYQGEFLPGFYEDWVTLERERIQTVFDSKMEKLLEQLTVTEHWMAVQEQAERWLTLGNTPEPAFRALMLASGSRGDMAKVSMIFQRCVADLKDQFGVEPSAETRALYEGLLKGAKVPSRTQPSGTVTFLFTDIEGSTNLLDDLGDQYTAVLETHHALMRNAIQKWNGTEVDTQGDSFFVTFTRALDAVQCVAQMQCTLQAHPWADHKAPRVRMGLHTGESLIASTGYVGMDVHRAARIGDAAHGGQVLLSQTTRELVMHDLPKGLTIRDLGEHRLKDLKFPTPIFQLIIEGLPFDFPPVRTKFTGTEAPTPGASPFKGLRYFEEVDSNLFFGRELLTAKLLDRLHESRFLSVIIGASGSGKSSLVRAGLIPLIRNEQNKIWRIHILTPTAYPLSALATELTRDSESVTAAAILMDDLMQDPRSLSLFLARQNQKQLVLLVIDQFEELFTLCRDEFEREAFIDNLLTTLNQSNNTVTLVLTLRADFYAHLAQYPELREAVAKHQEYIGPMTMDELRRAIEEPARLGHWEFEPGLVDLILRDVGDEPGALPLLSHALLETWKRRAGHTLTLKGYDDAGGVHGAIAHTAEGVYKNLSADEQTIARNIFLRLTELGEGTEDTRRRASFDELLSDVQTKHEVREVLNLLAEARLITLSEDTAEVAHEALIREWPTLREWLNQDREGLQLHRRLTEAVHEWEILERDEGMLYRGIQLAQASAWAALHTNSLNTTEKMFLEASNTFEQNQIAEKEAQQQRELESARKLAETEKQSIIRLRGRNRVITTIGSIAIILAMLAATFGVQSNQNASAAQNNAATAQADFTRSEAQRLALEANKLIINNDDPNLAAVLAIRSLNLQYTASGDAVLTSLTTLPAPPRLLAGHKSDTYDIAISPDGKFVVAGGADKTAILWDFATGKIVHVFEGHTDAVYPVDFSPDGKYIVTGSGDRTARLWDLAMGQTVQVFIGQSRDIQNIIFSPDGKYIITAGPVEARIWDVATGKTVHVISEGPAPNYFKVRYSPDGKYFALGSLGDTKVRLFDANTFELIQVFEHPDTACCVAFSPDGKSIATAGGDSIVRLWDLETGQVIRKITGHHAGFEDLRFSPDGRYLITANDDQTSRIFEVATGKTLRIFNSRTAVQAGLFTHDGKFVLTTNLGEVDIWSLETSPGGMIFSADDQPIRKASFSPDGKRVVTASNDSTARIWDTASGKTLLILNGHTAAVTDAVFSPDGKLILTGSDDTFAILWDASTGAELRRFEGHSDTIAKVLFSLDGKYIVTASSDGTARVWETQTGKLLTTYTNQNSNELIRAAFSPDGKTVATTGGDKTTHIWDPMTGKDLMVFKGHTDKVTGVAFSPDGKVLLTASWDGTARLWDVATGKELRQFIGHTGTVFGAAFSPNGKYVLTGGADQTARLWDAQTGQEIRRFTGHTDEVRYVAFSPDGKYILTASQDGTARLWLVDLQDTIRAVCAVLARDLTSEERTQFGITDPGPTCPKQ